MRFSVLFLILLLFLRQGLGWPGTLYPILASSLWESPCFSLLSAGIIGMYHHVQLSSKFQYCNVLFVYPISFNIVLLGSRCSPFVCAPTKFPDAYQFCCLSVLLSLVISWCWVFGESFQLAIIIPWTNLMGCYYPAMHKACAIWCLCSSSVLEALSLLQRTWSLLISSLTSNFLLNLPIWFYHFAYLQALK